MLGCVGLSNEAAPSPSESAPSAYAASCSLKAAPPCDNNHRLRDGIVLDGWLALRPFVSANMRRWSGDESSVGGRSGCRGPEGPTADRRRRRQLLPNTS